MLIEYNRGTQPLAYLPEFLELRNGKVWPNDRPGLGVTVDEKALTFLEEHGSAPAPLGCVFTPCLRK